MVETKEEYTLEMDVHAVHIHYTSIEHLFVFFHDPVLLLLLLVVLSFHRAFSSLFSCTIACFLIMFPPLLFPPCSSLLSVNLISLHYRHITFPPDSIDHIFPIPHSSFSTTLLLRNYTTATVSISHSYSLPHMVPINDSSLTRFCFAERIFKTQKK